MLRSVAVENSGLTAAAVAVAAVGVVAEAAAVAEAGVDDLRSCLSSLVGLRSCTWVVGTPERKVQASWYIFSHDVKEFFGFSVPI